jgi:hypothetical protein
MSHFYITLPSDSSMSFFPNNTVAEFTTKLPDRIILDGDYEVALSELIYPHSFSNIRNDDRSLYMEIRRSNDGSLESRYILDNDYYENTSEFLEKLSKKANATFQFNPTLSSFSVIFSLNPLGRIVNMELKCDRAFMLYFSDALKTKLGFCKSGPFTRGAYGGIESLDIHAGHRLMYVYCDIAAYSAIGNTKSPLLRVCDVSGKHGNMNRVTFTRPFYVPIARREFDTVVINIRDELGRLMPFEFGKSVATLHFRRSHSLLTSIS